MLLVGVTSLLPVYSQVAHECRFTSSPVSLISM